MVSQITSLDEQLTSHGVRVNLDWNTTIGNDALFDCAKFWIPKNGGRPPSCFAVIIYSWFINKVTDIVEADEIKYGRVLGGKPVAFSIIADNLGISWGAVQTNVKYLAKVGLLHRTRGSGMKEYSYAVINCRKEFKEKTVTVNGKKVEVTSVTRKRRSEEPVESYQDSGCLNGSKTTRFNREEEDGDDEVA